MKRNKILIISVILLNIIGIIMIYSSSYIWAEYKYNNQYKYLINQIIFSIVGIILMFITSKIDYKIYKKKANLIILICFILLVLVLIPGIGTVRNGSRSWFGIGGFGIQPSELAKIGLIIFVSKYLENNNKYKKYTNKFLLPIMGFVVFFFLLILLQPDFGTGMVIVLSIITIVPSVRSIRCWNWDSRSPATSSTPSIACSDINGTTATSRLALLRSTSLSN